MIEIREINVEHMFGETTRKGIVKVTMVTVAGELGAVEQLTPADARNLAADLFYAAARAEYDQDLVTVFAADDELGAMILNAAREGERQRMKSE